MRIVLLVFFACIGYSIQANEHDYDVNAEDSEYASLLNAGHVNQAGSCINRCIDEHGGSLVMCGALLCIGGVLGAGCWYAGAHNAGGMTPHIMQ